MESYLCVYLGSAFFALVTTPVVIFLAGKINAVDLPGTRNIHSRPIPRIGGVAIFTSTISLMLAVLLLDNAMGAAFHNILPKVIVLLSGSAFVFVVGRRTEDLRVDFNQLKQCALEVSCVPSSFYENLYE